LFEGAFSAALEALYDHLVLVSSVNFFLLIKQTRNTAINRNKKKYQHALI